MVNITDWLSKIAQSGILGVFCVIFMVVIYKLFTLLMKKDTQVNEEKDKRLADAVAIKKADDEQREATRETLELLASRIDGALKTK